MIAVLGASGYIGQAFVRFFESNGIAYRTVSRKECDYYCPRELGFLLSFLKPEFLVNCAGYTGKPNVDACEDHKAECLAANVYLPTAIAKACDDAKIPWGHVGSGCIYQGNNGGKGFSETDPSNFCFRTNDCSFYSGTKALAEEAMAEFDNCWQWRLRIPFNSDVNPRNYITKLLTYDTLLDVENSLSHLDNFAASCYYCIEQGLPFGVYNMTNHGSVTTRQVAKLLEKHKEFKFFKDEDEFMRLAAKTPRSSCVLDTTKAKSFDIPLLTVEEALESAIKRYQEVS